MSTSKKSDHASDEASELVDQHADALFRYAISRTRDPDTAEDLVQETFLSAIKSAQRFVGSSSKRTWLIGILRHKIADHFQLQAKQRKLTESINDLEAPPHLCGIEWKGDPASILEDAEFWRVFAECTRKLPSLMADAFYLREISQLPFREVCELLGITANNLGLRIFRARQRLRECLNRNWFNPESGE